MNSLPESDLCCVLDAKISEACGERAVRAAPMVHRDAGTVRVFWPGLVTWTVIFVLLADALYTPPVPENVAVQFLGLFGEGKETSRGEVSDQYTGLHGRALSFPARGLSF